VVTRTNKRLKVAVSRIISLPMTGGGVTTVSQSQNSSSWRAGKMEIPHRSRSSRCVTQWIKWCVLSFGMGKGWSFWISWNSGKPSTLTITYITTLTKLKDRTSTVWPEKTIFLSQHNNARPLLSLKTKECIASLGWTVLSHPLYNADLVPSDFLCLSQWKMDCIGNIFLATTPP